MPVRLSLRRSVSLPLIAVGAALFSGAAFAAAPAGVAVDPPQRVQGKGESPAKILHWMERAPEVKSVQPLLHEAAKRTGVDVELLKALIAVESGFKRDAVSPQGAVGLMQITPETADRYATSSEARQPVQERLRDARVNILTGARMLADLTQRLGRVDLALAAFNAGEGAVKRAGGKVPDIAETRAHVQMVMELYWQLLQRSFPDAAAQVMGARKADAAQR